MTKGGNWNKPANRTVRQFADQDYWESLSEAEREWLGKFNREYYGHNFSKDPIHKAPDAIKEAEGRENAARRDIWNNSYAESMEAVPDALLEDLSFSDQDYAETFKREGYEKALEQITDECFEDLQNEQLDKARVLNRYYQKRERLRRLHEADRRHNPKRNETNEE